MIQVIIASLLLVIAIEVLKIVRSLVVLLLSFIKETPEEPKQAEKAKEQEQFNPILQHFEQKHQNKGNQAQ